MRVVYVRVCMRAHYINVVFGGGVSKRFFNILPNSPHKSLSPSIDYAHKRNLIHRCRLTSPPPHVFLPVPVTFTLCTQRYSCIHFFLHPPLRQHTHARTPSLSPSSASLSSSPLLCDKRQRRMDVPFICTHIMF